MCGIVGIFERWEPSVPDVITPMIQALSHRGPDGEGVFSSGSITLGHRRLAVIDRSQAAAQPYLSRDKRYVIVFNGEIYNADALRHRMDNNGVVFRSNSDTEVLLEWLIHRGIDGLRDLDGMFAFALWDNDAETLWCCRDPLGIKPLFYCDSDRRFVFASEVHALLRAPGIPREPDMVALRQFFSLNYVLAPRTGVLAIRQLSPGCWMEVSAARRAQEQSYYRARFHPVPIRRGDAVAGLQRVLHDAVGRQLRSDVPKALWLSGGVDSSGLAAFWREHETGPITAYTACFSDDQFDEQALAAQTAAVLDLELRRVVVTPADVIRWIDDGDPCAEPTADSSAVAVSALARETKKDHTVVLSGEGADELLAGYITHTAIHFAAWWRRIPKALRRHLERLLPRSLPVTYGKVAWDEQLRRFMQTAGYDLPEAFGRWRQILSDDVLTMLTAGQSRGDALMSVPPPWSHWKETFQSQPGRLHGALLSDLLLYLPNDLLVKVDRASMRYGVEARVPYLSQPVVEFCLSLPEAIVQPLGLGRKALLRSALSGRVPDSVLYGKKRGLNVPIGKWFRGPLREWLVSTLTGDTMGASSLLRPEAVMRLVYEHLDGKADHGYALFGLIVFLRWWKRVF